MPELKMISPLLTNMEVVKCISVRGGTSVYIVKSTKSNQSYYLKHICIPESQKQVDALMFTGAAATVEDAQNYYKQVAADYQSELETLEKLSASPNIGCYRSYQIEPKEDGVGFEIYLLAEYRHHLFKYPESCSWFHTLARISSARASMMSFNTFNSMLRPSSSVQTAGVSVSSSS